MTGHLICPLSVLGADVVPGAPSPRTPRECAPSASWFLDQRLWLHRPGVWPRLLFLEQNQRPQGFPVWAPRGPAAVHKECGGCSSALKQLSPPRPPPGDRDPRRQVVTCTVCGRRLVSVHRLAGPGPHSRSGRPGSGRRRGASPGRWVTWASWAGVRPRPRCAVRRRPHARPPSRTVSLSGRGALLR